MSPTSTRRADAHGVTVRAASLRSVNLERDTGRADLAHYTLTARGAEMVDRLVAAMTDPSRPRVWSVTGPYGSGKSSLALLLDSLLDPEAHGHRKALQILRSHDESLLARYKNAFGKAAPRGVLRAFATARREPVGTTLGRALASAAERAFENRVPRDIRSALASAKQTDGGATALLELVGTMARHMPLLIVIDEFGKNLEYFAATARTADDNSDLFLLQELAELASGPSGLPIFMLTLQHLGFADYAARSTSLQRREWSKVQGRFEDVAYIDDIADTVNIIAGCLDSSKATADATRHLQRHATWSLKEWKNRGLAVLLPGSNDLFASTFPLHPLTLAALPQLCSRLGQHERTLVNFLASDEPHSVKRSLESGLPDPVKLPQVYDFFANSGRSSLLATTAASRWVEIETRISEATGLDQPDADVLKTVGMLNLIDASGCLRASPDNVAFALTDAESASANKTASQIHKLLADLVDRGFLAYREFSDEYRVWQGSDIDIRARVEMLRETITDEQVAVALRERIPSAIVAGKHSQESGLLRHFVTSVTAMDDTVIGPDPADGPDGLMLFHLGPDDHQLTVSSVLPVAIGTSSDSAAVLEQGRDLLALQRLRDASDLDAVARQEVREREFQAQAQLITTFTAAFRPASPGVRWTLLLPGERKARVLKARSLAGIASAASDIAYPLTPHVRNEMLGRHQLTSQGAKARRELVEYMLTQAHHEELGMTGYGPEMAMYQGVVRYMGLHTLDRRTGSWRLAQPTPSSTLRPAWDALLAAFKQASDETTVDVFYRLLLEPPFGIKAGVLPLVMLCALVHCSDEVAIFADGSYVPRITADLMERLVKTPERFSVKHVPTARGAKSEFLALLAQKLDARPSSAARNTALLGVSSALLQRVRDLSPFAQQTQTVSVNAQQLRAVLRTARDPYEMVFESIPKAVGHAGLNGTRGESDAPAAIVKAVVRALNELETADEGLRRHVIEHVAGSLHLPDEMAILRADLAARARPLDGVVAEASLRGFIRHALAEGLSDDEWLDPLAAITVGPSLTAWSDDDIARFETQMSELAAAFDRLRALHLQASVDSGDPFSARRLTLTAPDGHESSAIFDLPDRVAEQAHQLSQKAIDLAKKELGRDGARYLLAAITEELLGSGTNAPHAKDATTTPLKEATR